MDVNIRKAMRFDADTSAIRDELWPLVNKSMQNESTRRKYKALVNNFISARATSLYDNIPCDRIPCSEKEMDQLFDVLGIRKAVVSAAIKNTYYGEIANFSPLAAKHEFTVCMILIIKYFLENKMIKDCELACIHLSFSGKFYPSNHYSSYRIAPARHVMEYVVNNELSKKFDLVVYGSVFGAIKSVSTTWMNAYVDKFNQLEDEDVKYLIQQLISRVGSFIKNIAVEYYKAYEQKKYISYNDDSMDPDDYHVADSNILRIEKYTEAVMNAINTNGVDYKVCSKCVNSDITANECRAVIESIITNRENIGTIKELISLMISLYFATGSQDLTDISFIVYTISPKPNAKQKEIVRTKEIIEQWLEDSGTSYLKRRTRIATKNSYEKCVRMYFALIIHNTAR